MANGHMPKKGWKMREEEEEMKIAPERRTSDSGRRKKDSSSLSLFGEVPVPSMPEHDGGRACLPIFRGHDARCRYPSFLTGKKGSNGAAWSAAGSIAFIFLHVWELRCGSFRFHRRETNGTGKDGEEEEEENCSLKWGKRGIPPCL